MCNTFGFFAYSQQLCVVRSCKYSWLLKLWRVSFDLPFRFQLQSSYNVVPPTPAQTKTCHHTYFFHQYPIPSRKRRRQRSLSSPSSPLRLFLPSTSAQTPARTRPLRRFKQSSEVVPTPATQLQAPVSTLQPAHPPQAIARQSRTSLQDFHNDHSAKRTSTAQAKTFLHSQGTFAGMDVIAMAINRQIRRIGTCALYG